MPKGILLGEVETITHVEVHEHPHVDASFAEAFLLPHARRAVSHWLARL